MLAVVLTLLSIATLELATCTSSCFESETVSFDYGWRFTTYTSKIHCQASAFPQNLSAVQCIGLSSKKANNVDECRDICCNQPACMIWQYASAQGCWVGVSDNCETPSDSWVGGGRSSVPVQPVPKLAYKNYDDSDWEIVDVPHDGLINGTYDSNEDQGHGYLPTPTLWYRKHFSLPEEWNGHSIWIEFEGVFRASSVYLNGLRLLDHDSGYTTFRVRLDNTTLTYGDEPESVLAVQARAGDGYTGWWYEGGGIYRHTRLIVTDHVHFVASGIYASYVVSEEIKDHDPVDPTKGQYADVQFYPQAEVMNENIDTNDANVLFYIFDENDNSIAHMPASDIAFTGQSAIFSADTSVIPNVELWSITRPYLYKLVAVIYSKTYSCITENSTQLFGVRRTRWDANSGFFLNEKHFTWRGFNNHNDFTGVGVAVPDRINLFRVQMMRAVGANSWRMSHNPPIPRMLDMLDNLGVVVWDENRNFGNEEIWMQAQRDMVKRDRNHPSIMVWSFCNEGWCSVGDVNDTAMRFANVTKQIDPYRPVTANMVDDTETLNKVIDVQGFSHQNVKVFNDFHALYPHKPVIGSECCSCATQRGEDFGDSKKPLFGSFNGDCNQEQTGWQLNHDFVAGCMVWTLFDYYGEPSYPYGWPMVSTSYGSIDLAGFPKPSAYWYRTWWYYRAKSNTTYEGYDVPVNPPFLADPYATLSEENTKEGYIVRIVQSWEPIEGKTNRTIQAYSNAEQAELFVNGKSEGIVSIDWQGWAEWNGIDFSSGNITVNALDSDSQIKASHTIETAGAPAKVVATVDVPSERTGTGTMLVLDGHDAGLISAAIVDAKGRVVPSSSLLVKYEVLSGPGRIVGVGNGDPSCHEYNQAPSRSAYHGLSRVIIQVSEDSASSSLDRKRMMQIDRDGGIRTRIVSPDETSKVKSIVVQVSVDGLQSTTVSIPVTSDESTHGVMAVAKTSIRKR